MEKCPFTCNSQVSSPELVSEVCWLLGDGKVGEIHFFICLNDGDLLERVEGRILTQAGVLDVSLLCLETVLLNLQCLLSQLCISQLHNTLLTALFHMVDVHLESFKDLFIALVG